VIAGLFAEMATNTSAPVLVAQNIAFGIIAVLMIFSAIRVVTASNVVHAAAFLVVVLAGVAALFILLGAEFVAITQVLVYIGAIVVLFLFGIMLTRAPMEGTEKLSRDNWALAGLSGFVLLVLLGYSLWDGFGRSKIPENLEPTNTGALSDVIFGQYLVPFEVVSLLLLAALVGAIVIARRD
jgi:NADH-quinone oxidoreductase subunit J